MAFREFNEEVNTAQEREELKKLIAMIRIKRDLKKDNPGQRMITSVIERLEKQDYFEKQAQGPTENPSS